MRLERNGKADDAGCDRNLGHVRVRMGHVRFEEGTKLSNSV
jgi:hypothetical protein